MDQDISGPIMEAFLESGAGHPTLGLAYGRRRIGKSTLLQRMTGARGGFYWEATRTAPAVHLARLGEALGAHLGVGRLSFETWEEALAELLRLGLRGPLPVVLDEFGYLLAEDPTLSAASPTLHHSILGAIANGSVTAGTLANRLRRPVPNLDPALKRLISAGFVIRHEDPLRAQRPTYALAEAKAGETMGTDRLRALERVRGALGVRASGAKLLLFAPAFSSSLLAEASSRPDVELVDLDRLYHGG